MWEFLVNGGIIILSIPATVIGVSLWDAIGNIRDGRPEFNGRII